jgi:hypothetical protein
MPSVSISDFNLDFDGDDDGALGKYFSRLIKMRPLPSVRDLVVSFVDTPLRDVEIEAAGFGLQIEEDVNVGNPDLEWKISAGATAEVRFWRNQGDAVLSAQKFGRNTALTVPANRAYVAFFLKGQLATGVNPELADLTFGFGAGHEVHAAYYQPLTANTKLGAALEKTIGGFVLPGDLEDLQKLPVKAAATVGGNGRLSFSVAGDLATVINPVAVDIPVADVPLKVTAGAKVAFGLSAEYHGGYEVRVVGLSGKKVSLGVYRKEELGFEIEVAASAGASVAAGGQDLTERLLGALTGKPKLDREFLKQAGLSDDRIDNLKETVEAAINRKIEASLAAGFGYLQADEAAFLFTVDLGALDVDGQRAVRSALDGDFRELTARDYAGVRLERSIVTETVETTRRLRINLFGIFNYDSVFELIREGREVFDAASGELFFLDSATVKRRKAWINNGRELATEKVSKLMAETMMIAVAYSACRNSRSDPAPKIEHWYFEYKRQAKQAELKDHFDVAVALGLAKRREAARFRDRERYGRTALLAETSYSGEEAEDLFFKAGNPRKTADYEKAGRKAVQLLETGDAADGARGLAAQDEVFELIRAAGSRDNAVRELDRVRVNGAKVPEAIRQTIYTDYLAIRWWADSMAKVAAKIGEIKNFPSTTENETPLDNDNRFKKLRKELQNQLAAVAGNTQAMFGEPWGLVAMYLASSGDTPAHVKITTEYFVFDGARGKLA